MLELYKIFYVNICPVEAAILVIHIDIKQKLKLHAMITYVQCTVWVSSVQHLQKIRECYFTCIFFITCQYYMWLIS